ncbi:Putative Permease of the major facilitator superfamily, traB-like (fragment) [Thiomonas sp. CB3]
MSAQATGRLVAFPAGALRLLLLIALGAIPGLAWIMGGASPMGPLLSILLVMVIAIGHSPSERLAAALGYYATGCWPIVGAVAGYWGTEHSGIGVLAWAACSVALAMPWALAAHWPGLLFALAATALPPLGVVGWLSPLNAAGMLFPGMGWIGLALAVCSMLATNSVLVGQGRPGLFADASWWTLLSAVIVAIGANVLASPASVPPGWVGVQIHILPSKGNVLRAIQNNQSIIDAGLAQGKGARVLIFPEAVLENWLPGTRQQFAEAVPPGQFWLIGVQTDARDAVVRIEHRFADPVPVTQAAGLLLGGDWQPWNPRTLRPAWWQRVLDLDGQRVWAAICVEQVQPWTWLEALWQQPTVIVAQTNAWWAAPGSAAPEIQDASTRAWVRLMGVAVVTAVNL